MRTTPESIEYNAKLKERLRIAKEIRRRIDNLDVNACVDEEMIKLAEELEGVKQ